MAGMARPLRIEYPGAVYHVICRGNNRQNIFEDDRDRNRYLEKLVHYCVLKEVSILCYCLMSNHVLCGAQHKKCYVKRGVM